MLSVGRVAEEVVGLVLGCRTFRQDRLARGAEAGDGLADGGADDLWVELVVVVADEVAHAGDVRPGHLGVGFAQSRRQRLDRLADREDSVVDRVEGNLLDLSILGVAAEERVGAVDGVDGLDDVAEPLIVRAPHSGTASARALLATCGARASCGTTSTRSPSNAESSSCRAPMGNRPLMRTSRSISRSKSDSGRSSPRATDPKTRTFDAPCRWAARRIRSRLSRSLAILGVRTSRRRVEASATSSSREPIAARRRSSVSTDGELAPDSYLDTAGCDVPARAARASWLKPAPSRVVRINVAASIEQAYCYRYHLPSGVGRR